MPRGPKQRGDVCWATYTFPHERGGCATSADTEKKRPVLILQNDADNRNTHYPLVQAAPITTQKTDRIYQQDVLLPAGEANLEQTSKALLGLTQPFLKTRLGQKLGQLSPERMREVDLRLLRLFGFVSKQERPMCQRPTFKRSNVPTFQRPDLSGIQTRNPLHTGGPD